jgi:tetratricopeptide (TPR) repeat protein
VQTVSRVRRAGQASLVWLLVSTAVAPAAAGGAQPTVAPSLPVLPQLNLEGFLPVVRQQIQRAYDGALAHPEDATVSGTLGMVFDAYEQYDAATIGYERARRLDPNDFRWVYLLGWVQAAQGRHEEAARTLADALRLRPDDLPATLKRAGSLLAIGELEEAAAIYQRVIQVAPTRADAFYGLGRVAAARGDWTSAVTAYQQACDRFAPYGPAHYALSNALRKLGRDADAQRQLRLYEQDGMAVPPQDDPLRRDVEALNLGSVAHIRRGAELEQAGRLEDAIEEQLAAVRVDPQAVQAHVNLISLYGRLARYEDASAHYRAALALDPSQADIHYNYGVLLLHQQNETTAADAFLEALRLNPHHAGAHSNLGAIYVNRGLTAEAAQQFNAVLAERPTDRLAHFNLGRLAAHDEHYEEAIQHLTQTLEPDDASTPRYLYALGATYARAGRTTDALTYLRKAREQAAARGQAALVVSVEQDLRIVEQAAAAVSK